MAQWSRYGPLVLRQWPLAVVLVVAIAFRIAVPLPSYLYGDEAEYGEVARSLGQDPRALSYPDLEGFGAFPFVSQPPFLLYVNAAADRMVGTDTYGPLVVALLLGIATCGLVYGIGVLVGGRLLGFLAGLFLAVVPLHVNISRHGLLDAGLTAFATLAMLFFLWWVREPTRLRAVAVGVAFAAAAFTKLYGFVAAAPIVAGMAALWWSGRSTVEGVSPPPMGRGVLFRSAGWMALPTAIAGLAYAALLWYLRATRDLVDKLAWQAGRAAPGAAETTVAEGHERPWHWYFTDADSGLPAEFGFLLFSSAIVGLAWAVLEMRQRRLALGPGVAVLAWPTSVLLMITVIGHKSWFYAAPAVPGLALFAAWPVASLGRFLWRRRSSPTPQAARTATAWLAALVVLCLIGTAVPTGATMASLSGGPERYGSGVKEAALWIQEQDPASAQIGTVLGRFTLHFYNGQPTYHWYVPHDFVEAEIEAHHARFLVRDPYLNLTSEGQWFDGLIERYNGTIVQTFPGTSSQKMVLVYELTPI